MGEEEVDELGFGGGIDAFEGAGEADELGGRVFLLAEFGELGIDEGLLALAVEAAGEAAPEDVLLELDLFAGVGEAGSVEVPEIVDAGGIELGTEAGAHEESGEDEEGFLVLDGVDAAGNAALEGGPEGADEHEVPLVFRGTEDGFEALEEAGGGEGIGGIEVGAELGDDALFGGGEGFLGIRGRFRRGRGCRRRGG